MSHHQASVSWSRGEQDSLSGKYSRAHVWLFDGGASIAVSSSPHVVPIPFSDETAVDPEEAFIASIASCHMLWFLSIAAQKRFTVASYTDEATGVMAKNDAAKLAITLVKLQPRIIFDGDKKPSKAELEELHHLAHEECFIANSVKTEIQITIQEVQ